VFGLCSAARRARPRRRRSETVGRVRRRRGAMCSGTTRREMGSPFWVRKATVTCATSRLEAMPTMSEQRCIDLTREKMVANGMGFAC